MDSSDLHLRTLFGGPSQPEPLDERGGIQHARRKAAGNDEIANPNQYENDAVCLHCMR